MTCRDWLKLRNEELNYTYKQRDGYRLMLQCGIVQSVPCNCDYFMKYCAPHLSSNHF
jgi:hypothetical protein